MVAGASSGKGGYTAMNLSERFQIDGVVLREEAYGEGHINASYRIDLTDGRSFLLQQINTHVFQRPDWLM